MATDWESLGMRKALGIIVTWVSLLDLSQQDITRNKVNWMISSKEKYPLMLFHQLQHRTSIYQYKIP